MQPRSAIIHKSQISAYFALHDTPTPCPLISLPTIRTGFQSVARSRITRRATSSIWIPCSNRCKYAPAPPRHAFSRKRSRRPGAAITLFKLWRSIISSITTFRTISNTANFEALQFPFWCWLFALSRHDTPTPCPLISLPTIRTGFQSVARSRITRRATSSIWIPCSNRCKYAPAPPRHAFSRKRSRRPHHQGEA